MLCRATMKQIYKVEAFIVPTLMTNDELSMTNDELSMTNEIDDVKIANIKMRLQASPQKSAAGDLSSGIDQSGERKLDEIYDLDEPIYDEPIYDEPSIVKSKFQQIPSLPDLPKSQNLPKLPKLPLRNKYEDVALALPPKIPIRSSSLVSIDERGETDGILEEFCFHGYKNGCTASTQRPEEVSEEIFQDNWLRRLQVLRERESNLSDKERLLQERERLLFKKERELRILERLVREKLKEAELRLKLCQSSQSIESTNDAKTRCSENSDKSQASRSRIDKLPNYSTRNFVEEDRLRGIVDCSETAKNSFAAVENNNDRHDEKGTLRNPPNSRSSLWSDGALVKSHTETHFRTSLPVSSAYSSLRTCKPKIRPRMSYDDLDSTLSADIGDSSFVVTSRKFDPAVFKKPQAFTRSASERRPRQDSQQQDVVPKDSHHIKYPPHSGFQRSTIQDDKILKRTVENIVAVNQDANVKYQDYGLIDERVDSKESSDEARSSYLNLERGFDYAKPEKASRNSKDRPISWNEDTNEWLRKKRQAYNMANMRLSGLHFENKENTVAAANAAREKLKKDSKKKESRPRKFGIFR